VTAPAVTRWWCVRHAPVPGPEGLLKGRLDLPADTSDRAAFAALAARLPRGGPAITSTRLRCRQTFAALVEAGLAAEPAVAEGGLDEQDFGRLEGRIWGEIERDPEMAAFWIDPANFVPEDGESFAQLVARVRGAIGSIGARHPSGDILAVVHAGTIRAALAVALGISPLSALAFSVETLSLTRIDAVGSDWRVVGVNWRPAS